MGKSKRTVNPTDKARKEARKKELKKNKKQRQLVRSAVIEKKDPTQIITDLEKLDQLEYDALVGSAISDSLYKDKRKKLKDTWERVLKHYSKEDPDKHQELKKLESDYEASHCKKLRQYEAIKAAQDVKLEDIPLPPDPNGDQLDDEDDDDDDDDGEPLPQYLIYTSFRDGWPGCPPGVPPKLKDIVSNLKSAQSLVATSQQIAPLLGMPTKQPSMGLSSGMGIPRKSTSILPRPANVSQLNRNYLSEKSTIISSAPKLNTVPPIKPKTALLPTPTDLKPPGAAIIESKPIIFRPKVTKFVPSAVRKKQAAMNNSDSAKTMQE